MSHVQRGTNYCLKTIEEQRFWRRAIRYYYTALKNKLNIWKEECVNIKWNTGRYNTSEESQIFTLSRIQIKFSVTGLNIN